jgi:hypothetical protein
MPTSAAATALGHLAGGGVVNSIYFYMYYI